MDLPVPEGPEMTTGCVGDIVAVALVMGRGIIRREGVLLMVEGMGLEGLRKRVRRARVIRSLSPKDVGRLVFEGPGRERSFFGSTARFLLVRFAAAGDLNRGEQRGGCANVAHAETSWAAC